MRNRTENQITVVLIRHGATFSNREHRYIGKTDEGLSKEGKSALSDYVKQDIYPQIDCLFTSPMKRCTETAEILYPGTKFYQIPEWREMDFGEFEGKNYEELRFDPRYQEWIDSGGQIAFPGGESREAFVNRCSAGFLKMLEIVEHEKKAHRIVSVGAVVHGGTIMALLSRYANGSYFDYQTANGNGFLCSVNYRSRT